MMNTDPMNPESMIEPTPPADTAGIVTHRDEFSEPDPVPVDPGQQPNPAPIPSFHAAPTPPMSVQSIHSLSVQRIDTMISGLHGGIVIRAVSLFDEPVELLVRDIRSVTHHPFLTERRLETVSLDEMAKKLFGVNQEPRGLDLECTRDWNRYVQDSVLPVIELLEAGWIGAHAKEYNPVTRFFYGEDGILADGTDRETVVRKITDRTTETRVPVMTKHDGPAIVIAYTV